MDVINLNGMLASTLVLSTFCMRSMVCLRAVGILSNIAFISYAAGMELIPVLVLHIILLPVNALELHRLLQCRRAHL